MSKQSKLDFTKKIRPDIITTHSIDNVASRIQGEIEHLKVQIKRGFAVLRKTATYHDLYVAGFIPEGSDETIATKVINSLNGNFSNDHVEKIELIEE